MLSPSRGTRIVSTNYMGKSGACKIATDFPIRYHKRQFHDFLTPNPYMSLRADIPDNQKGARTIASPERFKLYDQTPPMFPTSKERQLHVPVGVSTPLIRRDQIDPCILLIDPLTLLAPRAARSISDNEQEEWDCSIEPTNARPDASYMNTKPDSNGIISSDSLFRVNTRLTRRRRKNNSHSIESSTDGVLYCAVLAEKVQIAQLWIEINDRSTRISHQNFTGIPELNEISNTRDAGTPRHVETVLRRNNIPSAPTLGQLLVVSAVRIGNHLHLKTEDAVEFFVFDFGCVCSWGASQDGIREFLAYVTPFLVEPRNNPFEFTDDIPYTHVESERPGILAEIRSHNTKFHLPEHEELDMSMADDSGAETKPTRQHRIIPSNRKMNRRTYETHTFFPDNTDNKAALDSETGMYCRDQMPNSYMKWAASKKSTIINDKIHLWRDDPLKRLAYSIAFAQSVKLEEFESIAIHTINSSRHIPQNLKRTGKIGLTNKEVTMRIGDLFAQRCEINLHWDLLGTPDAFWEQSSIEWVYEECREYLDIDKRIEILNQRLDVMRDMYELIQSELNVKHGKKLEWIIIILILAEVLLQLIEIIFFK